MSKFFKKSSKTLGLPPGSIIHVGEKKIEKTEIKIIDYNKEKFKELTCKRIEECYPFDNKSTVTWINVDGIYETEVIEKIGKNFNIHPLVLEDIVNTSQRPKIEDYNDYIYIVLKMLHQVEDEIFSEQVSFILSNNFVISFQESKGDVFNHVRKRISNNKGNIRKNGTDYLTYALIDAIVDHYFIILEKIGEKIEQIEEEVIDDPTPKIMQKIYSLKRDIIYLRRSVWPLREVISGMQREKSRLIKTSTNVFLRDLYDHTIQVMDTIETYRDMVSGMLDIYMSSVSNKMNEVMKVLTIFAAIFIPLTFIVGIYGMNFHHMPELEWSLGYPLILLAMLTIGIVMLLFFKRKKWL